MLLLILNHHIILIQTVNVIIYILCSAAPLLNTTIYLYIQWEQLTEHSS